MFVSTSEEERPTGSAFLQALMCRGRGIATMKDVRLALVTLFIVATFFANPGATTGPPDPGEQPGPASSHPPQAKADDAIFADGFETGDTSNWLPASAPDCSASLLMPTAVKE